MTRTEKGHFSKKHPPGTMVEPFVAQSVGENLKNGDITCAQAHAIADELNVDPICIGMAIDLQDSRIRSCQLGLFGHHQGKIVQKPDQFDAALADSVTRALVDGRLPCKAAWTIAKHHGVPRILVANVCEALSIRIVRCQLGAF